MKKIMNNVDAVENEMVLGMVKAYPQYRKSCSDQWWRKRT